MKSFFLEVNNGDRAGPIEDHVNNLMLRIFEKLPETSVVEVFRQVDSASPIARYTREAGEVVWYAPVRSRKQKQGAKSPAVRQSTDVGQWRRIGPIVYTEPDPQDLRPTTVLDDPFMTDLIENKWVM